MRVQGLRTFQCVLAAVSLSAVLTTGMAMAGSATGGAAAASPLEAGARYGQALGVVEICHGSTLTDAAAELRARYAGAELDTFTQQSAKVFDAWMRVKACVRQFDPNECKIIMDKSCAAARSEIGPGGSAIPGLVTFPY